MTATAKDSALVQGAARAEDKEKMTIEALRGFMCNGKPVTTGAVITVPARLARELIAMNKAVVLAVPDADADEPDEADDTEDSPKPRRGRPPKEKE